MNEGTIEQIVRDIETIKQRQTEFEIKMNEIHRTLAGGLDGNPGALQNQMHMIKDIYGADGNGGLKQKVEVLETIKYKIIGAIAAISLVLFWAWEAFKSLREPRK